LTSEISADSKHVLYAVRIIIERQRMDNVWQSHRWVVHDLVPMDLQAGDGLPPINNVRLEPLRTTANELSSGVLYTAHASLDLHRAEAEAYAENLASSEPAIYVVLRDNEVEDVHHAGVDVHLAELSLSPYNIQDIEDCGEDHVEKIPLQGPIAAFVEAFVKSHFKPEPFKKRKRDRVNIDEEDGRRGDPRLHRTNDVFRSPSLIPKRNYH
jgi:hypothetical protein